MSWTAPDVTRIDEPFTGPERGILDGFLDWRGATLLWKCAGLTGQQLALASAAPCGCAGIHPHDRGVRPAQRPRRPAAAAHRRGDRLLTPGPGNADDRRAARAIAAAVLGRDPGPMATAESSSHYVYVSPDVVVKIIDAGRHSRLDREITLAPHLPAGLTAPLLGSGLYRLGAREVRYACWPSWLTHWQVRRTSWAGLVIGWSGHGWRH